MAVVFDGGLPEERMEALETYKAQRDPMPDPLEAQLESIDEYLEAADIPWYMMEGQEADDLMATMAVMAAADGFKVDIATSDKDLYQMVNDQIQVVSPSKKGTHMGPAEVEEKTGVPPPMMIDWQALVGDTVDNIPGVPGVGPKTASKWLHLYGSVDAIYANLDELKPERFRNILREQREAVTRNLGLVKMRTDLPCTLDWADIVDKPPLKEKLLPFLEKYELHSIAKNLAS